MSIKVVCGCGFCTLLPAEWAGKRVKCKCGRTFIVGDATDIPLPPELPPARPPLLPPSASVEAERVPPPETTHAEAEPAAAPLTAPAPPVAVDAPRRAGGVWPHERRGPRARHPALMACLALLLAAASVASMLVVLRDYEWSVRALLGWAPLPSAAADGAGAPPPSAVAAGTELPATDAGPAGAASGVAGPEGSAATRLANLPELVAEDGLFLTGMFGDGVQRLELSETQRGTTADVVQRLKQNEQALKTKALTLEQWYAACHKLGDELLAVLTDAQRQRFQVLLERKEVPRVHLVDYAALIVPELAVAHMPWSVQTAGRPFRGISGSSFTAAARDRCCRASEPTGMLATLSAAEAPEALPRLAVWDLVKNQASGSFEVASPVADSTCLLSRDGRHWVRVRQDEAGAEVVEVWSTEAGKLIGSQTLPTGGSASYAVRDCVAHRVVALNGQRYWVWDFEADKTRDFVFPESRPAAAPCLAVSVDGSYLVVTHPHVMANPPDEQCVVEVCIYRLETGELLGNQVFHKEYRRSTVGALALSHDGRELALLWDVGPDAPARMLVYINAANGNIIKTVEGLPPADQSYARRHQLPDRDLIWLPENAGWVVGLQNVVDAETGAVLPLELPAQLGAGVDDRPASREVVEAVPAGDGRLLLIIADRPAEPDPQGTAAAGTMSAEFVDLPKLGPFQ